MKKYLTTLLFFCPIIFIAGCSARTIIVDSQTKLSESSKVDWVITKKDSTIDFRTSIDGYAKVQNDHLLFATANDSVNKLDINELKIIYLREDAGLATYIIGGVVAAIVVISYLLHNVNLTGG
ncbi:MAG: hypothetical protein C4543_06160 [Ignavibacteriales bacterium]|jgi:hypothetical protein|nr:MAG: hypothetical protein C4543_06160 [Ignavibacteriales bacterium]